jgi:hypothetical protein
MLLHQASPELEILNEQYGSKRPIFGFNDRIDQFVDSINIFQGSGGINLYLTQLGLVNALCIYRVVQEKLEQANQYNSQSGLIFRHIQVYPIRDDLSCGGWQPAAWWHRIHSTVDPSQKPPAFNGIPDFIIGCE